MAYRLFYRCYSSPEPRDALYHQRQAILRNSTCKYPPPQPRIYAFSRILEQDSLTLQSKFMADLSDLHIYSPSISRMDPLSTPLDVAERRQALLHSGFAHTSDSCTLSLCVHSCWWFLFVDIICYWQRSAAKRLELRYCLGALERPKLSPHNPPLCLTVSSFGCELCTTMLLLRFARPVRLYTLC